LSKASRDGARIAAASVVSRITVVLGLLTLGSAWRSGQAVAGDEARPEERNARIVYLMFADGHTPIPGGETCRGVSVPPAYHCALSGTETSPQPCANAIIAHLERWFGDFEITFTISAPALPHDTVVITSEGSWCMAPRGLLGDSPQVCEPVAGVSYVYDCDSASERCAALIAHEEGHLLGLEHVSSPDDLMAEGACWTCAGFEDRDNPVVQPSACARSLQNDHRLLGQRLGLRPLPEAGGCDVSGRRPDPAAGTLLGLALLITARVRGRGRAAPSSGGDRPRTSA
jgi:hypothetical protein